MYSFVHAHLYTVSGTTLILTLFIFFLDIQLSLLHLFFLLYEPYITYVSI